LIGDKSVRPLGFAKNIGRWLIDLLDRASQIVAGSSAASGSL
jgi:hypothetical protein